MVVGGAIDFDIPIVDDVTNYLVSAYNVLESHTFDDNVNLARNYVKRALQSNNNLSRLSYIRSAVRFLQFTVEGTSITELRFAKIAIEYLSLAIAFLNKMV